MSFLNPSLYFSYLSKLYVKNFLWVLLGLSFSFAAIDYFQHAEKLNATSNYKILYIFYLWQGALAILYPLAIVFALIMTKISLIKSNTMGAFHAFGYSKKKVFAPLFFVAISVYFSFFGLHTTAFSYAQDKADALLNNELDAYNVNDIFFKYNDTFVYINKLNPIQKEIEDITIFKVENDLVHYTINAPKAVFLNGKWIAYDAIVKTHIYENNELKRYHIEHQKSIQTLEGYKPKIIESLYEGKALNLEDIYITWKLLHKQHLNSNKIRAALYDKIVIPLFSIAMLLILFYKLPFHARMTNMGVVIALSLGSVFVVWGILFGLGKMGENGAISPELGTVLPIVLLGAYAIYLYYTDEKRIH